MEVLRCLGRAAEFRDNETGMHLFRISHMARLVALAYGMSEAEADIILQVAPLHDIGKIGVPDHILLKPGSLDAQDWEVMRRHTVMGAKIIGDHPSELMITAKAVALSHHEHWDGTGYPEGLCGAAIPAPARVVAIADVLDALLSPRPYKAAWTVADAMTQIKAESGAHFEPKCVQALLQVLPECLAVRETYRDDDSLGKSLRS
jgi:putative two-component system response regulator